MSTQSVRHPDIKSLKKEAGDSILKNADKYLLLKGYKLGEGYCRDNQADSAIMYDLIDENLCNIRLLINSQIENIEECCIEESNQLDSIMTTKSNYQLSTNCLIEDVWNCK